MRRLKNNRKAVSPVIATVLMILIVMAGMTILFAFVGSFSQSFQAGSGSSVLESLTIEDVWFKTSDNNLVISVYNTGKIELTINSMYINSTKVNPTLHDSSNNPIDSKTLVRMGDHVQIQIANGPWTSW